MLRFEGDPVAAVAATTAEIAEDAILRDPGPIRRVLPFVVTADDAIKPGASAVYPNDPAVINNTRVNDRARRSPAKSPMRSNRGCGGRSGISHADAASHLPGNTCGGGGLSRRRFGHGVLLHAGNVLDPRRRGQNAWIWTRATSPASFSTWAADSAPKAASASEGQLACRLSKQAGVPVKMALPRRDEFIMAGNGPGSMAKIPGRREQGRKTAGGAGGAIRSGRHRRRRKLAGRSLTFITPKIFIARLGRSTPTRMPPARCALPAIRQACFAMESLMDELAYKIGMDPVEFRIENLRRRMMSISASFSVGAKEIGWDRRSRTPGAMAGHR